MAATGFLMVKGEISWTLACTRGEKERTLTKLTITGACHGGYSNKVSQYQAKYYEKKMVSIKIYPISELSLSFWEPDEKKGFSSELILHKNDFITKTS